MGFCDFGGLFFFVIILGMVGIELEVGGKGSMFVSFFVCLIFWFVFLLFSYC